MNLPQRHRQETERLIKELTSTTEGKKKVEDWILEEGYYPEPYVLPPCFKISDFELQQEKFEKKDYTDKNWQSEKLATISFPKTGLIQRVFGIIHPHRYHDIVWELINDWDKLLSILFNPDNEIYSYSFPIALTINKQGKLRSGRMIYEFLEMAEKDLVAEAYKYKQLTKIDITNFYNSVYTHTIAWAWCGDRYKALADSNFSYTGSRIDKLIQYSNDKRTNGIPVGPLLSDLIVELILSSVDLKISKRLKDKDFIATRFKDDYRILCNTPDDAKEILKVLADELTEFNLLINESKTKILELPNGLYRQHDRLYHPHSVRDKETIPFKTFELTLLTVLDIHKEYPGTSILEKFFGELYNADYDLKIEFSDKKSSRKKEILKTFSLLVLAKRESEKILCHILSVIELIYLEYKSEYKLKEIIKELIKSEIIKANDKQSIFELTWYVFFARYLSLGINEAWINSTIDSELRKNLFLKSMCTSKQQIFNDTHIDLFSKPKDCKGLILTKRLAVFERKKDE